MPGNNNGWDSKMKDALFNLVRGAKAVEDALEANKTDHKDIIKKLNSIEKDLMFLKGKLVVLGSVSAIVVSIIIQVGMYLLKQ